MKLPIIEHQTQRVLTTSQLAESYGTNNKMISHNFNYNKERYKEGKHFFSLTGDEKKDFINHHEIQDGSKNAQILYLWTEKGAWLHAKSLNTDQAWVAYEMLVDDYYSIKQAELDTSQLSPELQMFDKLFKTLASQELETKKLESKIDDIKDVVALNVTNWREESRKLINKIAIARGGMGAYKEVTNDIYDEVERRGKCDLNRRLENAKQRLAYKGVAKSKINKVNKVDMIGNEQKLIEVYMAVVKDFAIKQGVTIKEEL